MGNAGQDPSKMNIEIWSLGASSESSFFIVGKLRICDLWWPTGLELHVLCLIRRDAAKKPTDSKMNCLERTLIMLFSYLFLLSYFQLGCELKIPRKTSRTTANCLLSLASWPFLLTIVCAVGSVLRHSHIARTNMRTYAHTQQTISSQWPNPTFTQDFSFITCKWFLPTSLSPSLSLPFFPLPFLLAEHERRIISPARPICPVQLPSCNLNFHWDEGEGGSCIMWRLM